MAPPEYVKREDAEDLIKRTVKVTLTSMGVDTSDPMEMQRDFQALREWRTTWNTIRSRGVLTIVGLLATGLVAVIVLGIKYAITKP